MNSYINLFTIFTFGISISIGFAGSEMNMISSKEKKELYDLILDKHKQISNLYVRYTRFEHRENAEETYVVGEWAMSGEKRYRKLGWSVPIGQPPSERYGVTVWDGKFLKAYDSLINNGSIRTEHDPANSRLPSTYSDYTRQLGIPDRGTVAELFVKHVLEDWEAYWDTPGKTVIFRSDDLYRKDGSLINAWTFDLERGALITRYERFNKKYGYPNPHMTMTVTEAKQIKSGIWLAMKSHLKYIARISDKTVIFYNDLVVDEIKVNEPEIDEMFHFEFPPGSQYYDFVIGSSMVAGASEKILEQGLVDQANELIELSQQAEVLKEQGVDDFEIAKDLTETKITPITKEDEAILATEADTSDTQRNLPRKLLWLFVAGVLLFSFIVMTVLRRQFVGKIKEQTK